MSQTAEDRIRSRVEDLTAFHRQLAEAVVRLVAEYSAHRAELVEDAKNYPKNYKNAHLHD
jgi:hypothetical protein